MNVLWSGAALYKAYHDPKLGEFVLLSNRDVSEGVSVQIGQALRFDLDGEHVVTHVSLQLSPEPSSSRSLARPADCGILVDAELELIEDAQPYWRFDPGLGVLEMGLTDSTPCEWGRLGESLVWVAQDEEHCLAGLVVEGISTDPGGLAQARWIEEVCGG